MVHIKKKKKHQKISTRGYRCRLPTPALCLETPGEGNVTLVFLPEESHAQRSLAGYSPCGCKE